jgi:serine/threonine protein kinase
MLNSEFYTTPIRKFSQNPSKYALENKIGKGGFGNVFKAKGPYRRTFAVKVQEYYGMADTPKNTSWNELNVLSQYRHENLIEMFDFWFDPDEDIMSLVLEYAEGTLYDVMKQSPDRERRREIASQLILGLSFLHNAQRYQTREYSLRKGNT